MAWIAGIVGASAKTHAGIIRNAGERDRQRQAEEGRAQDAIRRQKMLDDLQAGAGIYDPSTRGASIQRDIAAQQAQREQDLSGATSQSVGPNESADALAMRAQVAAREGDRMSNIVKLLSQVSGPEMTKMGEGMYQADLANRLASQISNARAMNRAYGAAQEATMRRTNKKAAIHDFIGDLAFGAGGAMGGGGGGGSRRFDLNAYNDWAERYN